MKDGLVAADGRSTCPDCGNVAKNERGHRLHWTLQHGKGRTGKYPTGKKRKYTKKDLPQVSQRALEVGPSTKTIEAPGEISGQKFILTVDLSIAATGIRPC